MLISFYCTIVIYWILILVSQMPDLVYRNLVFCNREINKFNRPNDRRYEEKLTASLDGEAQCFLNGARHVESYTRG